MTIVSKKYIIGFFPAKAFFNNFSKVFSNFGNTLFWNLSANGVKTNKFNSNNIEKAISKLPIPTRILGVLDWTSNSIIPIWTFPKIPIVKNIIPKSKKPPAHLCTLELSNLSSIPTFMNTAVRAGLITKATNNEEPKTTINVIGRNFINSPIIPGQKANGIKAANVVAVEEIMGQATSPTPSLAACTGV